MGFALFILYIVLSYVPPGEIAPALAPYRVTYWVGLAGLGVTIAALLARRSGVAANVQLWTLIAFTALMGASQFFEGWLGAPLLALHRFGPSLTMFVLALCNVTTLARLRVAAASVIVMTTTLMVQGAAAYHFDYNGELFLMGHGSNPGGDAAEVADDRTDAESDSLLLDDIAADHDSRKRLRIQALGLMNDPNDLALAMVVALGLIAGAWKPTLQLRHALLAAAAVGLVYGIYLTRSRGGAVALVVVLWRLADRRLGRLPGIVLLGVLATGVTAFDFGGRSIFIQGDQSAEERVLAWTEGLDMLKAQPVLGVGYGQFHNHHRLTAHNSLVLCFAETGLLGCFFWVGLLVVTLIELHGLKKLPGDEPFDYTARQWAGGLQLSLIGFMTAAFFLSRTFVPTLYLVIGLSAALAAIARSAGRFVPLPTLPNLSILVLTCELGGIAVVYTMVRLHGG
jgi:putative inorganic carbon (hco3(-)) transporter